MRNKEWLGVYRGESCEQLAVKVKKDHTNIPLTAASCYSLLRSSENTNGRQQGSGTKKQVYRYILYKQIYILYIHGKVLHGLLNQSVFLRNIINKRMFELLKIPKSVAKSSNIHSLIHPYAAEAL